MIERTAMEIAILNDLSTDACVNRILAPNLNRSFFLSMPWWKAVTETALDQNRIPRIYVAKAGKQSEATVLACTSAKSVGGTRVLQALSTIYSVEYGLVSDAPEIDATTISKIAKTIATERPAWDIVHLGPIARTAPEFGRLCTELRAAGFWVQPYFHFGTWFENTLGRDFAAFLADRPSALRSILKRKSARLNSLGQTKYEVVRDAFDVEHAIATYEAVYARSWKSSEPYPNFMPRLIREAASVGALRLGILSVGPTPIAAQVWIVWRRRATIFKLAHDERYKHASPGSILTMHMLRDAFKYDQIEEVDFGRGDDLYKRTWLGNRRELWGLLACNPRTWRGLLAILRHGGGAIGRRLLNAVTPSSASN